VSNNDLKELNEAQSNLYQLKEKGVGESLSYVKEKHVTSNKSCSSNDELNIKVECEFMGELIPKQKKKTNKTVSTCPYCGSQNRQMPRHVAAIHPNKIEDYLNGLGRRGFTKWPKKCEFCDKRLASKWHYDKHLRTHQKRLVAEGSLFCDKSEGPYSAKTLTVNLESHTVEGHKQTQGECKGKTSTTTTQDSIVQEDGCSKMLCFSEF